MQMKGARFWGGLIEEAAWWCIFDSYQKAGIKFNKLIYMDF